MSIWDLFWMGWVASGAVVEFVSIVNHIQDDTLSEHFRAWFHTDKKWGRFAWLWLWAGFSVWFLIHIAYKGMA